MASLQQIITVKNQFGLDNNWYITLNKIRTKLTFTFKG